MASVTPRAAKTGYSWRVQARVDGQLKQTTFHGPNNAKVKKAADQFADLAERVGWESAMAVREARTGNPGAVTLTDYTQRYLDPSSGILTGVEQGTREGYASIAERSFLQILGDMPLTAITRTDVGRWLAWQEKQPAWRDRHKPIDDQKPLSAKTIKNYHALLSSILKSAVAHKLIDENPAYKMRMTRGTKRENVFLSPAEFDTLLHFLPKRHQRFVLFLAGTGCRWGEATALTWADVALHSNPPTVRITKAWKKKKGGPLLSYPKTSRSRRSVSLFADLVGIMGTPAGPGEYVFPNETGGHLWHGPFMRAWNPAVVKATDRELCERLGLTPLSRRPTPHDLRHTHASWLIARGIPLPYIQARLGHESITTTVNTYGHLVPDAHDQMASAIGATLQSSRPLRALSE